MSKEEEEGMEEGRKLRKRGGGSGRLQNATKQCVISGSSRIAIIPSSLFCDSLIFFFK